MVYTAIGTLVAGYLIPKKEWKSAKEVADFAAMMAIMWWMQLCVSSAFWLAEFFYEEKND